MKIFNGRIRMQLISPIFTVSLLGSGVPVITRFQDRRHANDYAVAHKRAIRIDPNEGGNILVAGRVAVYGDRME